MHEGDDTVLPDFNRRAGTYEANAGVQRRGAEWLAEWIERGLPERTRMWELGSGTGFFTRELVKLGYRVLATDLAPEMVVQGRRACPDADWVIHDSWRLPENVCDRLYSSSLLQWMPTPEKTLRVFRAALRPGGKMLHGFFVAPSLRELYSLLPPEVLPLRWRTESEWLSAFEAAGFRILRAEARTDVAAYSGAAEFLKRLRDTGVTGARKRLSAGTMRSVMREYDRRFSLGGERGASVGATWRFFRVEARKAE